MPPVGVGMPPHGSHKMTSGSKPQQPQQQPVPHPSASNSSASGMSSKDKSQSNKMYPNAPPPYSNSAPQNPLMSRGGYPGASNGSQPPPPAGYVSQLCINTAIVYMHRFYAFHSFTHFHRNSMASASLFLAAKVEEQPRKLEHVIRAANKCLPPTTEQNYAELAQELVFNENVLLQTLGFDVAIDHPHTHVVRTCQLVKGMHPPSDPSHVPFTCQMVLITVVYFSMQGSGADIVLLGLEQVWLAMRYSMV